MGDVRYIPGSKVHLLSSCGNDIYLYQPTGEYLLCLGGGGKYEVMYKPQAIGDPPPVIGHKADMVMMDDVTIKSETQKPLGLLNFITTSFKTPAYEEQKMVIGGDKCHLCGQDKMYLSTSMRVSPHHVHRTCHTVYQCGTEIFKKWRDDECGVKDRESQNIHVGSDCLDI